MFKAVYIDKRELKCACVGGSSNVPLGFVSLTENLMMIGDGALDDMDVRGYYRPMLARLVLLIAVLLMPLGMTPAAATAHEHVAMASMPMGHCDDKAPSRHMKGGIADCAMACSAALPAAEVARDELPLPACSPARPVAAHALHGLHPETATPPPKLA